MTSFAFPVISGSGFLTGSGPLPKALPLTAVVGAPVRVTKWEGGASSAKDPAFAAAVEELHGRYCKALLQLWADHRGAHAPAGSQDMALVE